jgi:hypothetical protein
MSNRHSMNFNAGPYRGWQLSLHGGDRYREQGGRIVARIQVTGADDHGWLAISHGHPGYDEAANALQTAGREPMEKFLTWALDCVAGRLAEPDTIDPKLAAQWRPIVNAGEAARNSHLERWGDGGEPALVPVGAVVVAVAAGGRDDR